MGKKEPKVLNYGEWEFLQKIILTRIRYLIADTEILLNNGGQLPTVVALYIHAVEEFGKLVYVQNLELQNGIAIIDMNKFTDHEFKINLAQDKLPNDCFVLKQRTYDKAVYGRADYDAHEVLDWETRLTIFNTDIENGRVPRLPAVDDADIRKAVNEFKSHLKI